MIGRPDRDSMGGKYSNMRRDKQSGYSAVIRYSRMHNANRIDLMCCFLPLSSK